MEDYIYYEKIINGGVGKSTIRVLLFCFNWWRTIPCQIAYLLSNKKVLVKSDFGTYHNMVCTLIFAKHNRNLFYHRMGRSSILYSWVLSGEDSLKLPFSCKLGRHIIFVHNEGCHLNANSIGDNFVCYPHVVIGSKSLKSTGKPTIGKNVTIGTGAVIVGDIIIGDDVKIGANVFINQDIPSGSRILARNSIN